MTDLSIEDPAGAGAQPEGRQRSEVAMWHLLSGLPDNVTDAGEIVQRQRGRELSTEKAALRAAIDRLRGGPGPESARNLARLAAGYLLAGDVETARRYVARAEALAQEGREG